MRKEDTPENPAKVDTTTETGADSGTGAPATPEVVANPADQTATITPASGQSPLVPESAPGQVPAPTQVPRLSASTVPVAQVIGASVPAPTGAGKTAAMESAVLTASDREMVSIPREEFENRLLALRRIVSNLREARPGPYELRLFADGMDAEINALTGGVTAGTGEANG